MRTEFLCAPIFYASQTAHAPYPAPG